MVTLVCGHKGCVKRFSKKSTLKAEQAVRFHRMRVHEGVAPIHYRNGHTGPNGTAAVVKEAVTAKRTEAAAKTKNRNVAQWTEEERRELIGNAAERLLIDWPKAQGAHFQLVRDLLRLFMAEI